MSGNFRDPFGLAMRMLVSPNQTARAVIRRELARALLVPLDWALGPIERRFVDGTEMGDPPVVLVVGGPRSGTTIVYQILAACLPVSYTSNWIGCFRHAPITAGRLLRRWVERPALRTENYFGSTTELGGPNDAFNIWNRWFGELRGDPRPLVAQDAVDLRRFFSAWHRAFGKPLLNKNNRNTLCLRELSSALPSLCVVAVRRDPLLTAQSLIKSRREVQGDANSGWGLLARDADPSRPLGYVEAVCDQVVEFERRLSEQLTWVPSERRVEIGYRDFCEDPAAAVQAVSQMVFGRPQPAAALRDLAPLTPSTGLTLTPDELRLLRARLAESGVDPDRGSYPTRVDENCRRRVSPSP